MTSKGTLTGARASQSATRPPARPCTWAGHPKHKYKLDGEQLESSPEEDLWMLLDEKFDATQQCALTAQNHILACIT